jgi:hypothetical protein
MNKKSVIITCPLLIKLLSLIFITKLSLLKIKLELLVNKEILDVKKKNLLMMLLPKPKMLPLNLNQSDLILPKKI